MKRSLKETVFEKRIKKLKTISDIFKFLDINQFSEIQNDEYFKDISIKTLGVFYELSILWLQFELPELLLEELISKNPHADGHKIYKKVRSISTEKIKRKISETGLMEIASEIYGILDSLNSLHRAEEIFKLEENFFMVSPEEMIKRISVKIEKEKFLLNELSFLLNKIITGKKSKFWTGENTTVH